MLQQFLRYVLEYPQRQRMCLQKDIENIDACIDQCERENDDIYLRLGKNVADDHNLLSYILQNQEHIDGMKDERDRLLRKIGRHVTLA